MSGTMYENLLKNIAALSDIERRALQGTLEEMEHRRPAGISRWDAAAAYEAAYLEALSTVALRLKVYHQVAPGRHGKGREAGNAENPHDDGQDHPQ